MAVEPIRSEQKPSAGNIALLYQNDAHSTVSSGTVFSVTTDPKNDKIKVALVSSGNVVSANSYISYDSTLYFGENIYLQQISLGPNDAVWVESQNGTSNFVFTGQRKY
jgi:hypothetical protein